MYYKDFAQRLYLPQNLIMQPFNPKVLFIFDDLVHKIFISIKIILIFLPYSNFFISHQPVNLQVHYFQTKFMKYIDLFLKTMIFLIHQLSFIKDYLYKYLYFQFVQYIELFNLPCTVGTFFMFLQLLFFIYLLHQSIIFIETLFFGLFLLFKVIVI